MRRSTLLAAGCVSIASLAFLHAAGDQRRAPVRPRAAAAAVAAVRAGHEATLQQYCVTCHNERLKIGGLVGGRGRAGGPPIVHKDTAELIERLLAARQ